MSTNRYIRFTVTLSNSKYHNIFKSIHGCRPKSHPLTTKSNFEHQSYPQTLMQMYVSIPFAGHYWADRCAGNKASTFIIENAGVHALIKYPHDPLKLPNMFKFSHNANFNMVMIPLFCVESSKHVSYSLTYKSGWSFFSWFSLFKVPK